MSIRARLLAATAVIALVALVGAGIATYASLGSYLYGQVDAALELAHRPIEAVVSHAREDGGSGKQGNPSAGQHPQSPQGPPPGPKAPAECPAYYGHDVDTDGLSPGTFIAVRSKSGRTVWKCAVPHFETQHLGIPALPARITGFSTAGGAGGAGDGGERAVYFTVASRSGGTPYRVRASILRTGPDSAGQLIVAAPVTNTTSTLSDLRNLEVAAAAGAVLLALILGWWLVRASLHPLRDIERTADAISAGQLSERVRGDDARTEVGHVSRAFNVMLERIESAFAMRDRTEAELRDSEERMRRLVADASHELRTPLAAVRAYAELFDRGAAERPDDLRRAMGGIQTESTRMTRLVEELLLLAHLDEGRPLHLEPLDLVPLAAEAVSTASTIGPGWPVVLAATEPVEVLGDELRLRQVLDNLLANVRAHTPPGTAATVRVKRDGTDVSVSVSDDGPGLGEDEQRRIFERFFRADPSRSRQHGGAGLGLSIVDAIVKAHGGDVTVGASSSGGAEFTVRLRAADPARVRPTAAATPAVARTSPD